MVCAGSSDNMVGPNNHVHFFFFFEFETVEVFLSKRVPC